MALVTTVRQPPVGLKLKDGQSTLVAFAADPDVSFWEKAVKPPGFDGGEKIDNTTMHNQNLRTYAARQLSEGTDIVINAAYDPVVYDQIMALVNVEGSITILFSNGDTVDFFGYLQKFEPQEASEGEMPMAQITIVQTNVDPVTGAETNPNYKTAAGTD